MKHPLLTPELIQALIRQESADKLHPDGNDDAIGDSGNAFGCLQIWQDYMTDAWPEYRQDATDCLGNRELSIETVHRYMLRYATEKRLGRPVTQEDIARIHNGGPNGYKKRQTVVYWRGVHNHLLALRAIVKDNK